MTNIKIRFATINDCDELSNVVTTVIQNIPYYNDLSKKYEISKFQSDNLKDKIAEDIFSIILSIVDNKIVGFCLSRFDDYLVWLEWFGILKEYRGKGISKLLLTELDKTILPRKCHKVWCDCRTENTASIYILTSNGYNQLVTIPNHWYKQDFIL
jgi:RimJ/RimL family protein N-acetyltransferase